MEFFTSAPCKAILFGEHYVVYGSPALAIAIEPRNSVKFSGAAEANAGMSLHSVYGIGTVSPAGKYSGPQELMIFAEVASAISAGGRMPDCRAEFFSAWKLKGVGISASLCAAFAAGLFRLAGKKPSAEEIFAAAQAGDLVAHGGRASGIDAKTVSYGMPLVFQRSFSPPAFNGKAADFALPSGSALLLIDTDAGKRDGTGRMVQLFAQQFGIAGTPQDAGEEKRAEVRGEYSPLWERVAAAMKGGDARTLGSLMGENHSLLRKRGVSSAGIEKAVSAAHSSGAWGAKLTGAGGEGGAVLALCNAGRKEETAKKIRDETGFSTYQITLAGRGAGMDAPSS